jgi:peptide/nickel transport system permease protein
VTTIINQGKETVRSLTLTLSYFRKDRVAISAFGFIVFLVLIAIFANFVAPYNPNSQDLLKRLAGPTWQHPFGLDGLGRDILSRMIYGTRVSLQVGFEVIAISILVGTVAGSVAGYYGRLVDQVIMRIADVFLAFPGLILAIAIMAILGQGVNNVVIALSLVNWAGYSRVIRSQVLAIRELDFIKASKVMGSSGPRIILSHVIPNSITPLIVLSTIGIGWAILAEAGLSFIGIGVNPPTPSWGAIASSGRDYLTRAPHIATIAGLAIAITVLAFNLLGDSLRDALDPKLRT